MGKLIKYIDWEIISKSFRSKLSDEERKTLNDWLTASSQHRDFYQQALKGGETDAIEGVSHDVLMAKKRELMQRALSTNQKASRRRALRIVRDAKGRLVLTLERTNLDKVYAEGWRKLECFTVKAADGEIDLYGVMWKPMDFDSTKSYPIITYVYPGPRTEYIPLDFELTPLSGTMQLAQLGFVVVCFGNRGGSPYRGRDYHCLGYGNLRDYPLADNKYGLEQLMKRYTFIDSTKVGIFGHSGGGAMSAAAICIYPDFYTAAVASSGNYDNTIFDYGWSEIHHGIKEVVKGGEVSFEFSIPTHLELAKNLKGHLMLVTGDADSTVNHVNTYRLVNALIVAKKDFELVVLPGQRHGYMGFAKEYYTRKIWRHFARYLLNF